MEDVDWYRLRVAIYMLTVLPFPARVAEMASLQRKDGSGMESPQQRAVDTYRGWSICSTSRV